MTTTNTEVDSVQSRIVEEASRLFLRYGARNVKMDDIASALRISKRTIYEHFADKDELLLVCMRNEIEQQQLVRDQLLTAADNVIEGLFAVMNHVAATTREANPNLLREVELFHPRILDQVRETIVRVRDERTVRLIEQGIEEGLFLPSTDPAIMAQLLFIQFEALTRAENYVVFDQHSPARIVRVILLNFMRGIATRAGRELVDTLAEA